MSKCKCGYESNVDFKFCPKCGEPMEASPAVPVQVNAGANSNQQGVNGQSNTYAQQNPNAQQNQTYQQNSNGQYNGNKNTNDFSQKFNEYSKTEDKTADFEQYDVETNKSMAIISYIWILFIIPLLTAKNSPYAKFHANQGCALTIASIAIGVVTGFLNMIKYYTPLFIDFFIGLITFVISLLSLGLFVLRIIGLINAAQGKAVELPFIGKIKIIK